MSKLQKFNLQDFESLKKYKLLNDSNQIKNVIFNKLEITDTNINSINEFRKLHCSNIINYDTHPYKYYFAFSDIHGDLLAFFMTLIQNEIIGLYDNTNTKISRETIITNCITNYTTVSVLEEYLSKYEVKLLISNAIFFILGDVIDGARQGRNVRNNNGLNELLIHIILYNMRIDATTMSSCIKITLGNHDYINLFTNNPIYHSYADCKTLETFNFDLRKQMLSPFYLFDSSFFEIIIKNNTILGILCHASFTLTDTDGSDGSDDFSINLFENKTIDINTLNEKKNTLSQQLINSFIKKEDISIGLHKNHDTNMFSSNLNNLSELSFASHITQSRSIPNSLKNNTIENTCNYIKNYINDKSFIVIGHCITGHYIPTFQPSNKVNKVINNSLLECKTSSDDTDNRDCISANCIFNKIPKIIMVDNAWASPNSMNNKNFSQPIKCNTDVQNKYGDNYIVPLSPPKFTEMLLMKKNNTDAGFDFYIIRANLLEYNQPNTEHTLNKQLNTEYTLNKQLNSKYYKILVDTDIYVPERLILQKNKIMDAIDIKAGGYLKKYMKYKLKYKLLQMTKIK